MNKKIVKIYSTNGLATKKDLNGVEIRLNNKIKTTEVRMNTDLKAIVWRSRSLIINCFRWKRKGKKLN